MKKIAVCKKLTILELVSKTQEIVIGYRFKRTKFCHDVIYDKFCVPEVSA